MRLINLLCIIETVRNSLFVFLYFLLCLEISSSFGPRIVFKSSCVNGETLPKSH